MKFKLPLSKNNTSTIMYYFCFYKDIFILSILMINLNIVFFIQDFLSKCQAKQDEILQPINLTIKKTSEQKEDDNQNMNNLKHSMNTFKEKLHEDLIVNDDIEIKFLNEEYKLYSPTGIFSLT